MKEKMREKIFTNKICSDRDEFVQLFTNSWEGKEVDLYISHEALAGRETQNSTAHNLKSASLVCLFFVFFFNFNH